MTQSTTPVLIIGAGPVGLVAACELRRHGIDCRLIDQKPLPTQTSNALAIHARSLEVWQDMGILKRAQSIGQKLNGVCFYADSTKPLVHINFNEVIDSAYPYALSIPQSQSEQLLNEHLAQYGTAVEREKKLISLEQKDNQVIATVACQDGSTETITTQWLLGCDGYRSTVRKQLGIDYQGHDLTEHFIMIDAALEWPLPKDQVSLFPHQQGPAAVFPMKESCRTIIGADDSAAFDRETPLTKKVFTEQLKQRWTFDFKLGEPRWMSQFTIHERLAKHYRQQQAFLLGDAAHVHSPAGGQGMNTGMQDAYNLAWKLALVIKGQAKATLLDSYEAERRPVAEAVLSSSDKMTAMATIKSSPLIWLRNWLLKNIASRQSVQKKFAKQITGVGIAYLKSSLSKDYHSGGNLKAGMRAPSFIPGTKFHLLISESSPSLTAIKSLVSEHYNKLVNLEAVAENSPLSTQYDLKKSYCLIRPDQHIASFGQSSDDLKNYLESLLSQ